MAISSRSDGENTVHRPPPQGTCSPLAFIDLAAQQSLIRDRVERAIQRVLDHGQYVMGPEVDALEAQLCALAGARHAISCASGTDALVIAMMSLGVGRGDAVLCPAFTFPAAPEAIALLGATPVFVDVDGKTFNVAPEALQGGIQIARKYNLRPLGLIAADMFGLPADYKALEPLTRKEGMFLLCDSAQSFGAAVGDRRVGTFGTITATSFFPTKPLGCYGDGGALFTADDELAARMENIRLHGKARNGAKYDIERLGMNSRLDTIQAAILIEKLSIFAREIDRRNEIAEQYGKALGDIVTVPAVPAGRTSVWAQYTVRVEPGRRQGIIDNLNGVGVPTAVYYPRPLHQQAAFGNFPVSASGLAVSERLSQEVLSLPFHPYLTKEQQQRVIDSLIGAAGSC